MAKDVEDELKEEDDDGERHYGKKSVGDRLGRNEWSEPASKFRSGLNQTHKDSTRFSNSGWSNPGQKTGSTVSNLIFTSSLSSSGKKGENDRRLLVSERWKGVRSIQNDEMAEHRA